MRVIFTKQEVQDLFTEKAKEICPEGTTPTVDYITWDDDRYATVTFVPVEDATEDVGTASENTSVIEEKPIDLSEIPF